MNKKLSLNPVPNKPLHLMLRGIFLLSLVSPGDHGISFYLSGFRGSTDKQSLSVLKVIS